MSSTSSARLTRLLNGIGPVQEVNLARKEFSDRLKVSIDDSENLAANKAASAENIKKLRNGDVNNFIYKVK